MVSAPGSYPNQYPDSARDVAAIRETLRTRLISINNDLQGVRNRLTRVCESAGVLQQNAVKGGASVPTPPVADNLQAQMELLNQTVSEIHQLVEQAERIA